jgi:hypothetical protein
MGAVGPASATAVLYGFAPRMVERALPDAWSRVAPEVLTRVRVQAAARVLHELLGDDALPSVEELGAALCSATTAAECGARPLAAAWQALAPPDDPYARLWLAATVLREHRGDGHVLGAAAAGLSGLELLVTHVAAAATTRERLQPARGWTDEEWEAATAGLRDRGLVAADGQLTESGRELRQRIEQLTDELALPPLQRLGSEPTRRVVELATPLARALQGQGIPPSPNPIGLPPVPA